MYSWPSLSKVPHPQIQPTVDLYVEGRFYLILLGILNESLKLTFLSSFKEAAECLVFLFSHL